MTVYRWRKAGLLETVNVNGRQYLTDEAIATFTQRAQSGAFAKPHVAPPPPRKANSKKGGRA